MISSISYLMTPLLYLSTALFDAVGDKICWLITVVLILLIYYIIMHRKVLPPNLITPFLKQSSSLSEKLLCSQHTKKTQNRNREENLKVIKGITVVKYLIMVNYTRNLFGFALCVIWLII